MSKSTTRIQVSRGATGVWHVPRGFGAHYRHCAKDPATRQVLRSMLGLVGYDASLRWLMKLSLRERCDAEVYATREYAGASDNVVRRLPRPAFLPEPWRGPGGGATPL